MSQWHRAVVEEQRMLGEYLSFLRVRVPDAARDGWAFPGQYVELKLPSLDPKPFALASAPGAGHFEFLIRTGAPLADALVALQQGDALETTTPKGKGFPLDTGKGVPLILVGTGTGSAPLRAVVHAIERSRSDYGPVWFVFGGKSAKDFAWHDEYARWKSSGIELRRTVMAGEPGWDGAVGAIEAQLPDPIPDNAAVFVVGGPELVALVKAAVRSRGVPPERVFLNY